MTDSPIPSSTAPASTATAPRRSSPRRSRAPTTASSTSSIRSPRVWSSTTAGSNRRASTPSRASACAPSPARRRATPIPATFPSRRSAAPPRPCRRSRRGHNGTYAEPPRGTNRSLYGDESPLGAPTFAEKVKLLETIDAYARAKDPRVRQVTASLAGSLQEVEILRADGTLRARRPPAGARQRLGGRRRRRPAGDRLVRHGRPRGLRAHSSPRTRGSPPSTRRCARRWSTSARSRRPAGTFDVVLGPGWPGILLHEAVGHGLEGDFNRKKRERLRRPDGPARRRRPASPSSTTAPSPTGAARSPSTTRARRRNRRR